MRVAVLFHARERDVDPAHCRGVIVRPSGEREASGEPSQRTRQRPEGADPIGNLQPAHLALPAGLPSVHPLAGPASHSVPAARECYLVGFFTILSSAANTERRFGRPVFVPFGSVWVGSPSGRFFVAS